MNKAFSHKCYSYALLGVVLLFAFGDTAMAGQADLVLRNMVSSSDRMPGLLSGFSYMLGLILGVTGVMKLKEHVDNPNQTPLRTPVIRLLVGGGMFALPMVYRAMRALFNPNLADDVFTHNDLPIPGVRALDFNQLLRAIVDSFDDAPGFISAGAYMLGMLLGITALLKLKEHVENPDQTPLREGVIRLIVGGAMFAMPTLYAAMQATIQTGNANLLTGSMIANMISSGYDASALPCNGAVSTKVGNILCGISIHASGFPSFLMAVSYMMGLVMGIWGVFKIKAHVLNPQQTGLHEGIMRMLAAGCFFAVPTVLAVARSTLLGGLVGEAILTGLAAAPVTGYNETPGAPVCTGLDGVVRCFASDLLQPLHVALNFFSIVAGIILIMIGITRLTKSAQEGTRGPAGFGTIMTFAVGGALLSYNELIRLASGTLFGPGGAANTNTRALLQYTTGLTGPEQQQVHNVISAIIKFMIVVGLVSFVRGIFIIRDVSEGNQQASLMAGVTHMVGGALAVNLGPLINAVQATLGIGAYGIAFS